MIERGSVVVVKGGRSNPVGASGVVFWSGDVRGRDGRFYSRVGFKGADGAAMWDYAANVERVPSAEEVAAAERRAARDAVIAAMDWSAVVRGKESMEAYGGHWDCSLPLAAFPPGASDEDIGKLLHRKYPNGSSWGALRWSRGASRVVVDRDAGMVSWVDGYGMCD